MLIGNKLGHLHIIVACTFSYIANKNHGMSCFTIVIIFALIYKFIA